MARKRIFDVPELEDLETVDLSAIDNRLIVFNKRKAGKIENNGLRGER